MNDDPLYSIPGAVKFYQKDGQGPTKWTIQSWLSRGRLQRTKVGGRTMIRQSELEKMIVDGGKSPTPKPTKARQAKAKAS